MVTYNLEHLTQTDEQLAFGPIQDDEALFLFSIIRGCRINTILEIGGLHGYSSNNFLEALKYPNSNGVLYTCDINSVPIFGNNHKVIIKNGLHLTPEDLDNKKIELIFFDCHDMIQMNIYYNLLENGLITDTTIIALHDTNLHYFPYNTLPCNYKYVPEEDGHCHQSVERKMVNMFKELNYDIFSISTDATKHSNAFPFRHGLTICRKFKKLF